MSHVVDQAQWSQFSIFEQMGNIGSEVGRAFKAHRHAQPDDQDAAVRRALDLFAITISQLIAKRSPRAKEVLRARDQFLTQLYGDGADPTGSGRLETYFMQFAIAARLHR